MTQSSAVDLANLRVTRKGLCDVTLEICKHRALRIGQGQPPLEWAAEFLSHEEISEFSQKSSYKFGGERSYAKRFEG